MTVKKQLVFVVDYAARRRGLLASATFAPCAYRELYKRSALIDAMYAKLDASAPEHRPAINANAVEDLKEARAAMQIKDPVQRAAALRMVLSPAPRGEFVEPVPDTRPVRVKRPWITSVEKAST